MMGIENITTKRTMDKLSEEIRRALDILGKCEASALLKNPNVIDLLKNSNHPEKIAYALAELYKKIRSCLISCLIIHTILIF